MQLAHAGATLFMVGLIWFVQVVHYPLFGSVGSDAFRAYADRHRALTTLVVGPVMLAEAVFALLIVAGNPGSVVAWVGAALLGVCWASTFFVQVPLHMKLGEGFDAPAHRALVRTNWVRTAAWSARGVLALVLIAESASAVT